MKLEQRIERLEAAAPNTDEMVTEIQLVGIGPDKKPDCRGPYGWYFENGRWHDLATPVRLKI